MYIVVIAWIYVALMMAVAEATNTTGTVLGAIFTFLLYGAAPVALVIYLMGSSSRRRTIKAREQQTARNAQAQATEKASLAPDAGRETPTDPIAPVREEK